MSWYAKGNEGLKKAQDRKKEIELNRNKVGRFWLKTGEKAKIIFVDDDGFYCDIHQFKWRDKWNNFATCVKDVKPCPLCDAGLYPTWTAHYTIIDTREFEVNGKKYKNVKKLFPAKGEVIQIIADLKEKYGSLVGRVFEVKRYGAKEPNTGTHFEYIGRIKSWKKIGEDAAKPLNYLEILAPPTKEQYEAWGFVVTEELGSDEIEDIDTDDEILDEALEDEATDEDIEVEEDEDVEIDDEEDEVEEVKPKNKKAPKPNKAKKPKPKKVKKEVEDEDEIDDEDIEIDVGDIDDVGDVDVEI